MRRDYRFARRPRWLVGHAIALIAIVAFANLGMWQLRRHDERRALDQVVAARIEAPPLDLSSLGEWDIDELEYRQVRVSGTFDLAGEVVLQARSFQGRSGHNVLTPLVLEEGRAVIVNRGWVPIDIEGPPVVGAGPPPGEVAVVGVARRPERRTGFGPADSAEDRPERISRIDVARLAQQSSHALEPFYLQLVAPDPPEGFPLLLDLPEPGGGPPHLSYAVQWFAFTGVVVIGYPLLLRATAQKRRLAGPD